MDGILPAQLAWYVAGPLIGLVIVALYALANQHLGASGAYVQVAYLASRRAGVTMWQVWLFVGVIVGASVATLLRGDLQLSLTYGALGVALPVAVLIPLLFLAGVLMGYGARWAGGCTSGHGLSGSAIRSAAGIVTIMAIMASAVAVTLAISLLSGGRI
jgi:uncharacterized protein